MGCFVFVFELCFAAGLLVLPLKENKLPATPSTSAITSAGEHQAAAIKLACRMRLASDPLPEFPGLLLRSESS